MDYMLCKFVFGKRFKIIYELNWQLSNQESVTWPCDWRAVRRLLICLTPPSPTSTMYYACGGGDSAQASFSVVRSGKFSCLASGEKRF